MKNSISYDNEENLMGLAGIGASIFNHKNEVIAAFVITGDSKYIKANKDKLESSVRYTSTMVSKQFGAVR